MTNFDCNFSGNKRRMVPFLPQFKIPPLSPREIKLIPSQYGIGRHQYELYSNREREFFLLLIKFQIVISWIIHTSEMEFLTYSTDWWGLNWINIWPIWHSFVCVGRAQNNEWQQPEDFSTQQEPRLHTSISEGMSVLVSDGHWRGLTDKLSFQTFSQEEEQTAQRSVSREESEKSFPTIMLLLSTHIMWFTQGESNGEDSPDLSFSHQSK